MNNQPEKSITVIGGGTGTAVVLSGLKKRCNHQLNAVVVVSDSGGSTGRLRDEFGFHAVGDLRQCLASLSDGKYQEEIKKILLYRFQKGNGLAGHNLGNLILTALEDIYHSPGKSIQLAADIFKIKGKVYPVTEKNIQLLIEYQDGSKLIGEDYLDNYHLGGKKIKQIKLSPPATIYRPAAQAIEKADLVVLGPGDLYASLLPNTITKGFRAALKRNKGKFVYVMNLMTHYTQTFNMTAQDHLHEIFKYSGRHPDVVILNSGTIPENVAQFYRKHNEFPVFNDLSPNKKIQVVNKDLLSTTFVKQHNSDKVPRSYLRHDEQKLAEVILELI
ncbi:MAG: gluconeogenesis factor YvcK family protein [Patescibacteria group bacterium]